MKRCFFSFITLCLVITLCSQSIEIKDNWYYIDGNKFFVKGIGYEVGATPGQEPWNRTFDGDLMRFDLQRISEAGFNTIRTWNAFTKEEMDVTAEFDLKIIMGIWVDPGGNFDDPDFIDQAKSYVSDVLSYSKNYSNIIGYLIMNEPKPEHIFGIGYDKTVELWSELIAIIHQEHPGIPVSIANTSNGTYIESNTFDLSAYNVYIYNPVTVNKLHLYRDFIAYLGSLNLSGGPLIITEYGLSVSPSGEGSWGYGGNTLEEQSNGILHMYKAMVDGGAQGSCTFIYSDGWWKAGEPDIHNDAAEEWFGLVQYNGLNDKYGTKRPVWDSIATYHSAIITLPQSSEIYGNQIPIEIFPNEPVTRIDIKLADSLIKSYSVTSTHLTDTIDINTITPAPASLIFICYNSEDAIIKTEKKDILINGVSLNLPTIDITLNNEFNWDNNFIDVTYAITPSADFEEADSADFAFYEHYGFDMGLGFKEELKTGEVTTLNIKHYPRNSVNAVTIGGAFDVQYGNFQKRIVKELTLTREAETPTNRKNIDNHEMVIIYPNPATDRIYINSQITWEEYNLFSQDGKLIQIGFIEYDKFINVSELEAGLYFLQLMNSDKNTLIKRIAITPGY